MSASEPLPAPLALIAEDEPLIMMETADLLGDLGYPVLEARTAAQALTALNDHPDICLLVTDVQMPGPMQGFELSRVVHATQPDMRIIVCSGQIRPSADDLPPNALFVDKPLGANVLARTLQKLQPV
mgnify:CR=1 FL=1